MKQFAIRLMSDDSGQDLIEYALLAGFISLVAVVAITNVGSGVNIRLRQRADPGRSNSWRIVDNADSNSPK